MSLAVGEHSRHADLPEVLDALLQVVLQHLPLFLLVLLRLLLVPAPRGAAPVLLEGGARQGPQVQGLGPLRALQENGPRDVRAGGGGGRVGGGEGGVGGGGGGVGGGGGGVGSGRGGGGRRFGRRRSPW